MSPRKVNKEEKRREVALSCSALIHDVGMKKLTVAEVAKTAGIGKGTVYEYFDNKEDIIFEIINYHIEEHLVEFRQEILKYDSTLGKLELFFDFVLNDTEENMKHFNGYREFLSIVLSEDNLKMKEFNCSKDEYFRGELVKILAEGIAKGELKEDALDLVDGILTYQSGVALRKMSQANYDPKEDFNKFVKTILKLLEVE